MNDIVRPFLSDETGREINETLGQIRDILLRDETAVEKKDISFYDYDGTLLYSYTVEEANALTALPAGPTHEGLLFDGWNWSLEDVKSLTRPMDIGAMFATDDGTTRIYIHLEKRTNPRFSLCVNGTVTVDWGDGTAYDTLTGTDLAVAQQTPVHNYAFPGDYVIKLAIDGEAQFGEEFSGSKSKWLKDSISKIEIGANVTIGDEAFYNCRSLLNITIPNSITSIGMDAFDNCYSLLSVIIPSGVTRLEEYEFNDCFSLLNIMIPKNVDFFGEHLFSSCLSLQSITLPDLLTTIDFKGFDGCSSLSSITIPARAHTIDEGAFRDCSLLSTVIISNNVMNINDYAFQNCRSLSNVIIPDDNRIINIGKYAFQDCASLSNIVISGKVTVIQEGAFSGCDSLSEITIPNGVQFINKLAFFGCMSLSSVTLPDGLTTIADQAFDCCYEIACFDFTQLSSIPKLTNINGFGNIPDNCEIRVPASLADEWKTATNWTRYANNIVGV